VLRPKKLDKKMLGLFEEAKERDKEIVTQIEEEP